MPIDPIFDTPDHAAALHARAVRPADVDVLVTIPSNADSVIACVLGYRPGKLVLLRTRGIQPEPQAEVLAWLAAGRWPHAGWAPPRVQLMPESDSDDGLSDNELLPTLEQQVRDEPRRVAYLVTGGTKPHTALLVRHAQAIGSRVVHFGAPFPQGAPVRAAGWPEEIEAPEAVLRRESLARARALLRDRAFDAARASLEELLARGVSDPESLVALTLRWVEACRQRDALHFEDAASIARETATRVDRIGRPMNQAPAHRAIMSVCGHLAAVCEDVAAAIDARGRWSTEPRLPLVAELLDRAEREYAAQRRNLAALLYYRVFEACTSERLRVAYGIDAGASVLDADARFPGRFPEGSCPPSDRAAFDAAFKEAGSRLGLDYLDLRRPLGMLEQLLCLEALNDATLPRDGVKLASELRAVSAARNKGIYTHGLLGVDDAQIAAIRALLGVDEPQSGLLNLVVPSGTAKGELGKLRSRYERLYLDDDGLTAVRAPRSGQRGA